MYPILLLDIYDRSGAASSAHTLVISGEWRPIEVQQSLLVTTIWRSRRGLHSSASEALPVADRAQGPIPP